MDGQWVKDMAARHAVIELQTDRAVYKLPARQIDIDAFGDQFGGSIEPQDIKIRIEIDSRIAQRTVHANQAESLDDLTLLTPPIAFTLKALYGDRVIDMTRFGTYNEHWILLPNAASPAEPVSAFLIDPDGNSRSVPARVMMRDDQYYARVSSIDNGLFIIAASPDLTFSDTADHWARHDIQDMVNRSIIMGIGDSLFEPNRHITRAEFAAMLVRGFGLPAERDAAPFSDIDQTSWYSQAVNTMHAYRFITGFEDGTFRPHELVTREQSMVIIARVAAFTGLDTRPSVRTIEEILMPYRDAAETSDWALAGIAHSLEMGIIQGKTDTMLAPQHVLTRSEAAAIIRRLLVLSDLI